MSKPIEDVPEIKYTVSQLKEIKADLRPAATEGQLEIEKAKVERMRIKAEGLSKKYELRSEWSGTVKKALMGGILFQTVLISWVGVGWWRFEHQQVFLNTVATELFLQIAGMGYIIVRCLFPEKSRKAKKDSN